jgi:hypothetical protein
MPSRVSLGQPANMLRSLLSDHIDLQNRGRGLTKPVITEGMPHPQSISSIGYLMMEESKKNNDRDRNS